MPQQDPALAILEMHRSAHAALQRTPYSFASVHVPTAAQHYGISNKTLYGLIASGNVREGVSFDYLTE